MSLHLNVIAGVACHADANPVINGSILNSVRESYVPKTRSDKSKDGQIDIEHIGDQHVARLVGQCDRHSGGPDSFLRGDAASPEERQHLTPAIYRKIERATCGAEVCEEV